MSTPKANPKASDYFPKLIPIPFKTKIFPEQILFKI